MKKLFSIVCFWLIFVQSATAQSYTFRDGLETYSGSPNGVFKISEALQFVSNPGGNGMRMTDCNMFSTSDVEDLTFWRRWSDGASVGKMFVDCGSHRLSRNGEDYKIFSYGYIRPVRWQTGGDLPHFEFKFVQDYYQMRGRDGIYRDSNIVQGVSKLSDDGTALNLCDASNADCKTGMIGFLHAGFRR